MIFWRAAIKFSEELMGMNPAQGEPQVTIIYKKSDSKKSDGKKNDTQTQLLIEGELTIYRAAELKAELVNHFRSGTEFELDLSQVTEIDSAGVQILMLAKRELSQARKSLQLSNHSRAVLDVFELLNLAPFFGDPLFISGTA